MTRPQKDFNSVNCKLTSSRCETFSKINSNFCMVNLISFITVQYKLNISFHFEINTGVSDHKCFFIFHRALIFMIIDNRWWRVALNQRWNWIELLNFHHDMVGCKDAQSGKVKPITAKLCRIPFRRWRLCRLCVSWFRSFPLVFDVLVSLSRTSQYRNPDTRKGIIGKIKINQSEVEIR